ncbi:MAG: hypothetical protein AAFU77_05245 [Myxococcota bacterium]
MGLQLPDRLDHTSSSHSGAVREQLVTQCSLDRDAVFIQPSTKDLHEREEYTGKSRTPSSEHTLSSTFDDFALLTCRIAQPRETQTVVVRKKRVQFCIGHARNEARLQRIDGETGGRSPREWPQIAEV